MNVDVFSLATTKRNARSPVFSRGLVESVRRKAILPLSAPINRRISARTASRKVILPL